MGRDIAKVRYTSFIACVRFQSNQLKYLAAVIGDDLSSFEVSKQCVKTASMAIT